MSAADFEACRTRLLAFAYRMLGSRADAEDMVQEAWLRWANEAGPQIVNPIAWLTTVTTRLCLDHLKKVSSRRERYAGHWLPEPWLGELPHGADPDALAYGLLVLIEQLSPLERAVFLLHEAFDLDHGEIATALGCEPAASRQLLHRAREHLRSGQARHVASRSAHQALLFDFLGTIQSGNLEQLKAKLLENASMTSDGGGNVKAARNVVRGRDAVARGVLGLAKKAGPDTRVDVEPVNGQLGVVLRVGGKPTWVIVFESDGRAFYALYLIGNPDKLRAG